MLDLFILRQGCSQLHQSHPPSVEVEERSLGHMGKLTVPLSRYEKQEERMEIANFHVSYYGAECKKEQMKADDGIKDANERISEVRSRKIYRKRTRSGIILKVTGYSLLINYSRAIFNPLFCKKCRLYGAVIQGAV